ncbi:MAG: hypothetical protein ACI4L8_10555, partial [Candidatus Fimadaptatus sp.]
AHDHGVRGGARGDNGEAEEAEIEIHFADDKSVPEQLRSGTLLLCMAKYARAILNNVQQHHNTQNATLKSQKEVHINDDIL